MQLSDRPRGANGRSGPFWKSLSGKGLAQQVGCSLSGRFGDEQAKRERPTYRDEFKHEWTKHHQFETPEDARLSVFTYIETFSN